MGLEIVELIIAVEEKYRISIPDEEASKPRHCRGLHNCVIHKLELADNSSCLSQHAFHLLRRSAIKQFGVSRKNFRPDTKLDSFIPRTGRRHEWLRLQKDLGASWWPELRVSMPDGIILAVVTLSVLPFAFWFGVGVLNANFWLVVITGFAAMFMSVYMSRFFYASIYDGVSSRVFVRERPDLLAHCAESAPARLRECWTAEEVWAVLCTLINNQRRVWREGNNQRFKNRCRSRNRLARIKSDSFRVLSDAISMAEKKEAAEQRWALPGSFASLRMTP